MNSKSKQSKESLAAANDIESAATFSRMFFQVVGKSETGNMVVSPLGAMYALALTQMVAGGKSAIKIQDLMCVPDDSPVLRGDFNNLFKAIESKLTSVGIASAIFISDDLYIHFEDFESISLPFDLEAIDFYDSGASQIINSWITRTTKGKTVDVLPTTGSIDSSELIMINTVWFQAVWSQRFNPNNTAKGKFFLDRKNFVEVPFMRENLMVRIAEIEYLDAQLIEIPYKVDALNLVVLIPNKLDGLNKLEKKLKGEKLNLLLKEAKNKQVCLLLPRFRVEYLLDLQNTMKQFGMEQIFEANKENLIGVTRDEPSRHLHQFLQKLVFDVKEGGTESYTSSKLPLRFGDDVVNFCLDHPFIFFVTVKPPTSPGVVVLLSGRLVNPSIS